MSTLTIRTVPAVSCEDAPRRPSLIGRFVAHLVTEWQVRRDLRRLEMLDAHMLHDIGLTGGGLEDAVRHGRPRDRRARLASARDIEALSGSSFTDWR